MTPTKADLEAAKTIYRVRNGWSWEQDGNAILKFAELIATAHQAEREAGKRLDELCDLLLHDFAIDKRRLANAISEYRKSIE